VLKAIFDQIVEEAEQNPRFAERLLKSLPVGAIVEVRGTSTSQQRKREAPETINPVKLLRESGEIALQSALDKLMKADLVKLAKLNQLDLPAKAKTKSATKPTIVEALVGAAKFRLRERAA
jgi:hypothetical protein